MQANITQNSKKNVAVIVVVPLIFGIMIGLGIQTTDAQLLAPQFGDRDINRRQQVIDVEEEQKIGEINRRNDSVPTIEWAKIDRYRASTTMEAITYKITYSVIAGNQDLKDIQIRAHTDMGEWDFNIPNLDAFKNIKNVARLKALDPDSITGEIIGWTATGAAKIKPPPN